MQFTLTIECGNDAFHNNTSREIARILAIVADRAPDEPDYGHILDYNGNRVGRWELSDEDEEQNEGPYMVVQGPLPDVDLMPEEPDDVDTPEGAEAYLDAIRDWRQDRLPALAEGMGNVAHNDTILSAWPTIGQAERALLRELNLRGE